MTTYANLRAQIQKLEAQAQEARDKEVAEVIARIKSDIEAYGLTAADIGLRGGRGATAAKKTGRRGAGVPKYRDPETGKTWTGQGKPPNWIAGKDREAFLIEGASAAESPAPRRSMSTAVKKAVASRKGATKPAAKAARGTRGSKSAKPASKSRRAAKTTEAAPEAA